jgi:dTDP-4-dehydrorhamnose 3,5-epimerase
MIFTEGALPGTYILDPDRKSDSRGFFARSFCLQEFAEHGLAPAIVQANVSFNHERGTLRGMHYQAAPHQEIKIVRCTRGALYDVIVDVRPASPTHGQWMGVELTEHNGRTLYVPEGFAHGYITLADDTEVMYFVTASYAPQAERGLRYDDPTFGIEWPHRVRHISEKDASWPDYAWPSDAPVEASRPLVVDTASPV